MKDAPERHGLLSPELIFRELRPGPYPGPSEALEEHVPKQLYAHGGENRAGNKANPSPFEHQRAGKMCHH